MRRFSYSGLICVLAFVFNAHAERQSPKPVKPVSNAGLRYEVAEWEIDNPKMKENGGFVRVVNTRSGLPVCTKQVYVTKYDPLLETDVQDNFITNLRIEGKTLVISSENLAPIRRPIANFCD